MRLHAFVVENMNFSQRLSTVNTVVSIGCEQQCTTQDS